MLERSSNNVFVTGASSIIGSVLVPLLEQNGMHPVILGRKPVTPSSLHQWQLLDLTSKSQNLPSIHGSILIHTASIWLLDGWLEKFKARGVDRVIVFSSTSRFTKGASASSYELEIVNKLVTAENLVVSECERLGIGWTIFRPTLIYGGSGSDRNVADIARFIRKFGFFPLFGGGRGRRQPVQAHDLAMACIQSMNASMSRNKAYNLSGGETLTYAQMVSRIFKTLGRPAVYLPVPILIFRAAVAIARLIPRFKHLTVDMALRMQVDLVFDHADANRDFGYSPSKFAPTYLTQTQ